MRSSGSIVLAAGSSQSMTGGSVSLVSGSSSLASGSIVFEAGKSEQKSGSVIIGTGDASMPSAGQGSGSIAVEKSEINDKKTACIKPDWKTAAECSDNQYLNNSLRNNLDWKCVSCPDGGDCKGSVTVSTLLPEKGWWPIPLNQRTSPKNMFAECLHASSCPRRTACFRCTQQNFWVIVHQVLRHVRQIDSPVLLKVIDIFDVAFD